MAFIREYGMAGDPGKRHKRFGGLMHRLRHIKFGGLISPALGLIPGGGAALSAARSFGYEGDPGPRAHPRKVTKPSHQAHPTRRGHTVHRKAHAAGGGISGLIAKAGQAALEGYAAYHGDHPGDTVLGQTIPGGPGGEAPEVPPDIGGPGAASSVPGHSLAMGPDGSVGLVPHGVKHRMPTLVHRRVESWIRRPGRRVNPANVHALRRGIRRIGAFQNLVATVERAYPRMRASSHHARAGRSARGHKPGCGCFACKRRSR
jgi:hypothetical protein